MSLLGAWASSDGLVGAIALALTFFAVSEAFSGADVRSVLGVLFWAGGGLTVLYGLAGASTAWRRARPWGSHGRWTPAGRPKPIRSGTPVFVRLGLVLAAAPWRAERSFQRALSYQSAAAKVSASEPGLAASLLEASHRELSRAESDNPLEPVYPAQDARVAAIAARAAPSSQKGAALGVARDRFERALRLAPRDAGVLQGYAEILLALGRSSSDGDALRTAARDAMRRAHRANPYLLASQEVLGAGPAPGRIRRA